MLITNDLAAAYVLCPYKALLRQQGENAKPTNYAKLQSELEVAYRRIATERFSQQYQPSQITRNETFGGDGLVTRHRLRLNIQYSDKSRQWTFNAIEFSNEKTANGKRELAPIRFSHGAQINQHLKLLAALDAVVLSQVQGIPVRSAKVIYGPNFDKTTVKLKGPSGPTNLAAKARHVLAQLENIHTNESIKLVLNRHCDVCEFREHCHQEAVNRDDLSLLKGLSPKEIEAFNERGIFTVTQLAHTFRAKSMGRGTAQPKRHSMPLQAKAINDNTVYIRKKPEVPPGGNRIFFDVEGVPESDRYYLIGMLIENEGHHTMQCFWADSADEEQAIWQAFVSEIHKAGDCPLIHFGRYERDFISCMVKRYGPGDPTLMKKIEDRLFDVYGAVRTNIFFPVHSNGLKSIYRCLFGCNMDRACSNGS